MLRNIYLLLLVGLLTPAVLLAQTENIIAVSSGEANWWPSDCLMSR